MAAVTSRMKAAGRQVTVKVAVAVPPAVMVTVFAALAEQLLSTSPSEMVRVPGNRNGRVKVEFTPIVIAGYWSMSTKYPLGSKLEPVALARHGIVHPVELPCCGSFKLNVDRFGRRGLHPECQFIGGNA